MEQFAKQGTVVLGISTDTLDRQEQFTEKSKLNFPLLADPEKKVTKAFGARCVLDHVSFDVASESALFLRYGAIPWLDLEGLSFDERLWACLPASLAGSRWYHPTDRGL